MRAALGAGLLCAAVSAQALADQVVVLNSGDGTVSLIDQATRRVDATFVIGKQPHHLMPTPHGRWLVVADALGNDLVFLDPRTGRIERRVPDIEDPYQIGFSPNGKWFVTNGLRLNRVDIYHYRDHRLVLARRIPLGRTPSHLWFTSDSRIVFVTLQDSDQLAAIDVPHQKLLWTMPIGPAPAGVWLPPGDRYLFVALTGSDYVAVVDWRDRRIVKRIHTGQGAHNFRWLADGRHVAVSNRVASTISIIDYRRLIVTGDITGLRPGPDDMELTANRRDLWVTFRWARRIGIVDLASRKLVDVIRVGRSPHGIYFQDRAPVD